MFGALSGRLIQCQKLRLSGKIPIVVLDSPEIDHGLYVLLYVDMLLLSLNNMCVVDVILWVVPRWTIGLLISPCELILVLSL